MKPDRTAPGNLTSDRRRTAAHSLSAWLPLTMTRLYDQMRFADGIESVVLADNVVNLASFPWSPRCSLSRSPEPHPQVLRGRALLSRFSVSAHPTRAYGARRART